MKTYVFTVLRRSFALLVLVFMFACQKDEKKDIPDTKEIRSPLKNNRIKPASSPADSTHKDSLQSVPTDTIKPPLMNYQHFKKTFSIHRRGYISGNWQKFRRQENFAV